MQVRLRNYWVFHRAIGVIFQSYNLIDEPTGNLDHETQNEIMNIFRKLADEGKCVILVSYSMDVAGKCDETYELKRIRKQKINNSRDTSVSIF